MIRLLVLLLVITVVSDAASLRKKIFQESSQYHTPLTFKEAKAILFDEIFNIDGMVYDIYCDKIFKRYSNGINVEHAWPQSKFNKQVKKELQKGDLYHLFAVDKGANSARGSDPFADVKGGALNSDCTSSKAGEAVNGKNIYAFEPPLGYKGDIARAMFYFSVRYELPIERLQEMSFRLWHVLDPVDDEEYRRSLLIKSVQGNSNPFIERPELVDQFANF